jgi:hypothetical protein
MIEPFDIGYPERFGSCHIGLYQPMENKFLLTLCNVQHAQDIALIISGRYPVFLVDLTSAENYCENLIDNLCCTNWSLPAEQVLPTQIPDYSRKIVAAKKLIQNYNLNSDLAKEQQYLQMIWLSLRRFDQVIDYPINYNGHHGNYGWAVKHFMATVFDQRDQTYENLQNIKKQLFRELFLGRDLESVSASLENIFAKLEQQS